MIKKLNYLLTKKEKFNLICLLILSLFLAIIEIIGIGAIMPFISVVSNQDIILTNQYYSYIYKVLNFNTTKEFILYFGIVLMLFYIFRGIYIVYYGYLLNKFSMNKYTLLIYEIYKKYINMPYATFVNKNTGTMSKTLISEAYQLAFIVQNVMIFISEILVIILMYVVLLFVNIKMTLLLTIILGIKVLLLKLTISGKLKIKGNQRAIAQNSLYKMINETFGNFKIIKFISNQERLSKSFLNTADKYSNIFISSNTLQLVPRSALEMTGFGMLIALLLYMVMYNENAIIIIPLVTMYALALYRILPAITKILNTYNNIIFHSKSLDIVYDDLSCKYIEEKEEAIKFNKFIQIKNLSFSYTKKNTILQNINLKIKKGQSVAFIGESGSGKSTLVDLICGIYRPDSGNIYIDDTELTNDNIVSWRKKIGYIPQSIYLFDGTIAENISFGRDYDEEKIIKVLKQANIYDTIKSKDGLHTMVGEGGIQLSGGQKQRIGIARALYGDPEILVLDEATSALDTATETAIMEEIYKVSQDKTLMIIAHRLSTIEKCDVKIDVSKMNK